MHKMLLFLAVVMIACQPREDLPKPNVILIITDDQGYGDLGALGNEIIQTPNIDKLHQQSVRFTDFHVATTCAPTRGGLLTGLNCHKAGIWHTIIGRSLLWEGIPTMADIFAANDYRTGIFGKWHLGDNYPFRPQDRGFQEVLVHGGGGIWQTPDYWNNDYFDDTYFHNGEPQKYEGYCTDIWFENALEFIEENKDNQFFCYLATNAPHGPYHVSPEYSQPYENNLAVPNSDFYGMIANLDENVGKLENKLDELGLTENTILIFMTDNGTAAGVELNQAGFVTKGFNAGMRGMKGSEYDGGHRVPFFIRWPAGGFDQGKDIENISYYADVMPTLFDLCQLPLADSLQFDGASLKPLITGKDEFWQERILIVDTQRKDTMEYGKNSAVMSEKWRLIRGEELYNIEVDSGQKKNVISQYPEIVDQLNQAYDQWWKQINIHNDDFARIIIGSENENPSRLTCHDWHPTKPGYPAWNQTAVKNGNKNNGFWALKTASAGTYQFSLYRYPPESGKAYQDSIPPQNSIPGGFDSYANTAGKPLKIQKAILRINNQQLDKEIKNNPVAVDFELDLPAGDIELQTWWITEEQDSLGAYYVVAEKID
jgi:arylsulfatase A-like enzyme